MRAYGISIVVLAACSASSTTPDAATTDASPERKVPIAIDAGEDAAVTGPDKLSETGLYSDITTRALAPGVIAYTPRWPVWSDGATSARYVSLPSGLQIDTSAMDDWSFPVGTKMWESFTAGGTLYETRFSWKKPEGWWIVSYAWLADGTDAIAAPGGIDDALGTGHEIPPQEDCVECHSQVRDVGIGVSALQLGASEGDGTLAKLVAMNALSTAPAKAYDVPGTGVTKDALGYLHGNCAHCHNDSGSLRSQTQMRLRVRVTDETPEETEVYRTAPYLVMKHPVPASDIVYTIVPGSPSESGLLVRIALRGGPNDPDGNPYQMPPVGTNVVDDAGVATVRDWLSTMRCGWCQSMIAPQ
jgi:hypothetical protein